MDKIDLNIEALTMIDNLANDLLKTRENEVGEIPREKILTLLGLWDQIITKIENVLSLDRTPNTFIDDHLEAYR